MRRGGEGRGKEAAGGGGGRGQRRGRGGGGGKEEREGEAGQQRKGKRSRRWRHPSVHPRWTRSSLFGKGYHARNQHTQTFSEMARTNCDFEHIMYFPKL